MMISRELKVFIRDVSKDWYYIHNTQQLLSQLTHTELEKPLRDRNGYFHFLPTDPKDAINRALTDDSPVYDTPPQQLEGQAFDLMKVLSIVKGSERSLPSFHFVFHTGHALRSNKPSEKDFAHIFTYRAKQSNSEDLLDVLAVTPDLFVYKVNDQQRKRLNMMMNGVASPRKSLPPDNYNGHTIIPDMSVVRIYYHY